MNISWWIFIDMNHDLFCNDGTYNYLSMENIYKSKTSRTMNFDTNIQSSINVQNWMTIRTMGSFYPITTIISYRYDYKLFQNRRKIRKTLDIWTWNFIYKNNIHTNPRIR